MEPAARRTYLREQLGRARAALDAGDRPEALAAVDRALDVDPEYLAAQALRERIVRLASQPAVAAPVSRVTPPPAAPERGHAAPDAPALAAGLLRFEERTRARRIEKRAEAARVALASGRLGQARAAINDIAAIDPDHPAHVMLLRELDARARSSRRRWPVPAAALVVVVASVGVWRFAAETRVPPRLTPPAAPASVSSNSAVPRADELPASPGTQPDAAPSSTPTLSASAPAPASTMGMPPVAQAAPTGTSGPDTSPAASARETADAEEPSPTIPLPALAPLQEPLPQPAPVEPNGPAQLPGALASPQPDARVAPSEAAGGVVAVARGPLPALAPAASAPVMPRVRDEELVMRALQQYRRAYDTLDARAAQAVWPAVDGGALQRAFDGLISQRLTFQSCELHVSGASANADCRGTAHYTTRMGSREVRDEPRSWQFTLRKTPAAEWQIESARVAR